MVFVFVGAENYCLHPVGEQSVGYSPEIFESVHKAAGEGIDIAPVCELHVYGSGISLHHDEKVKLTYFAGFLINVCVFTQLT